MKLSIYITGGLTGNKFWLLEPSKDQEVRSHMAMLKVVSIHLCNGKDQGHNWGIFWGSLLGCGGLDIYTQISGRGLVANGPQAQQY